MKIEKPIVVLDVETTGLSRRHDHIIQLSAIKVDRNFNHLAEWSYYILPEVPFTITPAAQETHGITKEFLEKNGVSFRSVAQEFIDFIEGADLAGFNSNSFDMEFIGNLLASVDHFLNMNRQFYDVRLMELQLRPNTLEGIYKRYTGQTMEEAGYQAHDSLSDVKATIDVFSHQMKSLSWDEVDEWSCNKLSVPCNSIHETTNGAVVFSSGKYKDMCLAQVFMKDKSYLKWWADNVASPQAKELARVYIKAKQ